MDDIVFTLRTYIFRKISNFLFCFVFLILFRTPSLSLSPLEDLFSESSASSLENWKIVQSQKIKTVGLVNTRKAQRRGLI